MVDRLSTEYADRVEFVIHDQVWSNQESGSFAAENGIRGIPAMVLVEPDGTEIDRTIGAVDEPTLRAFIDSALQ